MADPETPAAVTPLTEAEIAELLVNDEPEVQQTPADPIAAARLARAAEALARSAHRPLLRGIID